MTDSFLEADALYSSLAADPDLCELADMYVDEMPDKMAALQEALDSNQLELLRQTAHQMKGSAGSYGFNQLTPYAAALESSIRENKSLDEICGSLNVLLSLCGKVRAGQPQ